MPIPRLLRRVTPPLSYAIATGKPRCLRQKTARRMVDAAFLQEKGEFNATRQNLRIFRQPIFCFCNYFLAEKNITRQVLIWRFCANFASPKLNIENRHKKHPRKSSVTIADGARCPRSKKKAVLKSTAKKIENIWEENFQR